MTPLEDFEALVALGRQHVPGFEIRYKNESLSSKVLGVLSWVFNRRYMTDYVTTRYPRVFFPSREFVESNYRRAAKILAHELVHLFDRQQRGAWFDLQYALPQVAAVAAVAGLLGILSPWGLLGLLPLLALAPWPSPGRTHAEIRGYAMSLVLNEWCYGPIRESSFGWVISQFTGSAYWFMWWSGDGVRQRLNEQLAKIRFGDAGEVYELVNAALYPSIEN